MYYPLHIKATLFIDFCATVHGHTSQDRSTLACSCKPIRNLKAETSFSAIGKHLLKNPSCARKCNDSKFSFLSRGRTAFHLSTLGVTCFKTSKPNLCKQKKFVYGLKIRTLFSALSIGRFFYQSRWSLFFFLFRQLCFYISDSFHLFH